MQESDIQRRAEELKQKANEARRQAYDEETRRLEQEIEQRAHELLAKRQSKIEQLRKDKLNEAQRLRQQAELSLNDSEREIQQKLEEERRKKVFARQRELEERKLREELERKHREEEARRRAEEERLRLEEEARRKEEEEKLRKFDEQRQQQIERLRLEDEIRQEKERRRQELLDQARAQSLVANARTLFKNEEFENALVEVTKVFASDPENPEAFELEIKIKEALGKKQPKPSLEKEKEESTLPPIGAEEKAKKKKITRIAISVVVIVGVLVVGIVLLTNVKKDVFRTPVSIAVLPWSSQSAVLEEKIIGSSLAEEVTHRLQSYKLVMPMGYPSAYRLTQYSPNFHRSVFELGYSYALLGTLDRIGDVFSVDVRLVDSTGNVDWSRRYERTTATLAELPRDIAQQLASGLDIEEEKASTIPSQSRDPNAYQFYLRALDLLHRRTPTSMQNALQLLQQAIEQDEQFADALAIASSAISTGFERGWLTNDSLRVQAERLAERAVSVDPANDAGYIALGKVYADRREYAAALQQFDAALKLSPNNGTIYFEKANVYLEMGSDEQALESLNKAYQLSPRDPLVLQTYAGVFQLKGQTHEGFWYHETALLLVNDSTEYLAGPIADAIMGDAQLLLAYGERVNAAFGRRVAQNPKDYVTMYRHARLLQVMGKAQEATEILRKIEQQLRDELKAQPKNAMAMVSLALTLTRLGRFPEATYFALQASGIDSTSADVKYKIAQMYSIQMFSLKKQSIDQKKKEGAVKALKDAVARRYRLDELTNADFYNMHQLQEFLSAIKEQLTQQ